MRNLVKALLNLWGCHTFLFPQSLELCHHFWAVVPAPLDTNCGVDLFSLRAPSLGPTCHLCSSMSWGGYKGETASAQQPRVLTKEQAQCCFQAWQAILTPFPVLEEISPKRLRWLTGCQGMSFFFLSLCRDWWILVFGTWVEKRREIKWAQIVRKIAPGQVVSTL